MVKIPTFNFYFTSKIHSEIKDKKHAVIKLNHSYTTKRFNSLRLRAIFNKERNGHLSPQSTCERTIRTDQSLTPPSRFSTSVTKVNSGLNIAHPFEKLHTHAPLSL